MKLYHPTKTSLTLGGVVYSADGHGVIEVPDSQMNSSVWTQGFVDAKGRIAQVAEQAQAEQAAPAPTPLKPVKAEPKAEPVATDTKPISKGA